MFAASLDIPATYADIDAAEQELIRLEDVVARARARQAELLAWLDSVKVARVHGARSIEEWTAAHLDVAPTTARKLVTAARSDHEPAEPLTFDRRVALIALQDAGGSDDDIARNAEWDLRGLRRRTASLRRTTRLAEREVASRRCLRLTPTLGEAAWDIAGLAPGHDGDVIATALTRRADDLLAPTGESVPRAQRMLDALTALAQDYLDGRSPAGTNGSAGSSVTVFIDATSPEPSAEIAAGPMVGPDTVDRIVCEGSTRLVAVDGDVPVATTRRMRRIPPSVREIVLHRDGSCVIDGCRSRYRLQPHHIVPWAEGGGHDAANLATLCWYHHHVAVHGYGKRLDPDSPSHRRRFRRPTGPDPPR